MPRASESPGEKQLVKLLLCGEAKIGKSWYAGLPAMQGFNVLYLDGDVATQTIQHKDFPAEAKPNIFMLDCGDKLVNGLLEHRFADMFRDFTTKPKFLWDDTKGQIITSQSDVSESEVWEIRAARMDHTMVLVIDSWTSLVQSVVQWAARAEGVDLQNTNSPQMRPVYQACSNKLTQFLVMIQRLGCHVICIAHPDEYQKMSKPEGVKAKDMKEADMKIEWTRLVPKSSSKPHSMTMGKYFTDVAWMGANSMGERLLDFRVSDERIIGGHFSERKKITEYTFAALVRQIGGIVPESPAPVDHWLTMYPRGEYQVGQRAATAPVLGGGESAPVKKGFGALAALGKKS